MRLSELMTLYDYNCWARDQILAITGELDAGQAIAPAALSYGSILGALTHILNAEWLWRMRCQERESPTSVRYVQPIESLEKLGVAWREEETAMRGYLGGLDESQLDEPISYRAIRGQAYENLLWQILVHLVYHGTHHRSELAAHLTELSHPPGNFDFIVFLRDRRRDG